MKVGVGETVVSADRKEVGHTTGASHPCGLEGCSGRRISVKWGDKKHTFPCTRGMKYEDGKWYIIDRYWSKNDWPSDQEDSEGKDEV